MLLAGDALGPSVEADTELGGDVIEIETAAVIGGQALSDAGRGYRAQLSGDYSVT
jgi:hypothetical protein